jgi:hypothetical protein
LNRNFCTARIEEDETIQRAVDDRGVAKRPREMAALTCGHAKAGQPPQAKHKKIRRARRIPHSSFFAAMLERAQSILRRTFPFHSLAAQGGMLMILIAISLMASTAAVQAPVTAAPAATAPAAPASTADAVAPPAQAAPVEEPDLYAQMVHAAAEVARHGELPPDDSVDHARRMAGSDRNKERYFNRPGATEAEYQNEWNGCRQIARRLASPNANPALMSAAFTQGGMVGGLLVSGFDAAFSQLRARRDIRRRCMVARGWRLVEPDDAGQARIASLSREDREAYFARMLSATEVEPGAHVTDRASLGQNAAAKSDAARRDSGE